MKYFYKELVQHSPVKLSSGAVLTWEMVANDTGVLATEDPSVIGELEQLAKDRRGVAVLTQEKYESLKKNPKFVPDRTKPGVLQELRLINRTPELAKSAQPATEPASASPVAEQKPAPAATVAATSPSPKVSKAAALPTKRPTAKAPAAQTAG